MKKIRINILLYSMISLLFMGGSTSCVEDDFGKFTPKNPDLKFGQETSLSVGKDTATYEIAITSNLPWRVKTNVDWITLKTSNGLESGKVSFFIAKNPNTTPRIGKLIAWITTDSLVEVVVNQEAGDPLPDISIDYYVKTTGSVDNNGLSWETATTIDKVLGLATSKDRVHIAAGTYVPTVIVTKGTAADNGDKTFEIKVNATFDGGYPANAMTGAIADGVINKTILSGKQSAASSYHVVTVTAPIEDNDKVIFNNINVTGGNAAATGTAAVTVNGLSYPRINGSAMAIGKSVAEFNSCRIYENQSLCHTPGVYVFSGANVIFNGCSIDNNKGTGTNGNGGGLWNDASTIYVINSSISSNVNTGVAGGIYAYNASLASKTYFFNSTIDNNKASHKAGYYGRENSECIMVNCTVYGNNTTNANSTGAGIGLYANATKAKLDIISCTITNNTCAGAADTGGGIRINDANCTLNIYNSIISGNTTGGSTGTIGDIFGVTGTSYSKIHSIVSSKVFDVNGLEVPAKSFDFSTMLAPFDKNGGLNSTCLLVGDDNPAATLGMSGIQLMTLGIGYDPVIAESIITFDQLGKSRAGKNAIGSCVK